jgi:Uma2 family endonuclease
MHAIKYEYISIDDYLVGERDVDVRSEYVDGQIYTMSGASAAHNLIAGELFTSIHSRTAPPCQPFMSDMKIVIRHQGKNFAYYPDLMVACDENNPDNYTRNNPILIVEVLSPSTQRTDLGEKFVNYTQIPTLREYVIVSQDTPTCKSSAAATTGSRNISTQVTPLPSNLSGWKWQSKLFTDGCARK